MPSGNPRRLRTSSRCAKITIVTVAELVLRYFQTLVWPIIVVVVIVFLRKPLRRLLGRLTSAETPGPVKLTFAEQVAEARETVEKVAIPETSTDPTSPLRVDNTSSKQPGSDVLPLDYQQMPSEEQARRATAAHLTMEAQLHLLHAPHWGNATPSRRKIRTLWGSLLTVLHAGLVEIAPLGWTSSDQYTNVQAMLDGLYAATGIPAVRAVGNSLRRLNAAVEQQGTDSSQEDLATFVDSGQEVARTLISIMREYRKLLSWAPYETR